MKTCSLYGFIMAVANSLLVLVLYFLGFHSDPAKLGAAKWIGGCAGLAVAIVVTVLGIKARRSEVPEGEAFGYGAALGAGVLISVVSTFLYSIFFYVYNAFINTGFNELMIQDAMDKMQAKGVSGAQADNIEKGMRFMMSPGIQAASNLVFGVIFGTILSLIIAAFLKRKGTTPPVQA
jgi:hypothetical protein